MRLYVLLTILMGLAVAQADTDEVNDLLTIECNPDTENCALKEVFGITKKVERNFLIMGVQAWMRAFSGPHLIVFLPQAYFWTKVRQGNSRAAKRFIWVT